MNKGFRQFVKIIYYIFFFILGIVLAIMLPQLYLYDVLAKDMNNNLKEGKYSSSMALIGGYYDEEYVYQENFSDQSGIVIFKALTIEEQDNSSQVHLCYSGFLFSVRDKYQVSQTGNNDAKILVNDTLEIQILNYDSNEDEVYDNVNTLVVYDYIYFEIVKGKIDTIDKIDFIDANGGVYQSITGLNLNYEDLFFTSLERFVDVYNNNPNDPQLETIGSNFLAGKSSFKMGSFGQSEKKATKKAVIYVVIYFLGVYILGDFLVGKRYIIHFFFYLSAKLRGKKEVKREAKPTTGVYGLDYYTQLEIKLIVPEDCESNICIRYSNENDEFELVFSKDKNYTAAERIHAGKYVNVRLESNDYEAINLPECLDVHGYKMTVEVKLEKKEKK